VDDHLKANKLKAGVQDLDEVVRRYYCGEPLPLRRAS
jgi:hypothetical protein